MAFPIPQDEIQERPTTRARLHYLLVRIFQCLPDATVADLLAALTDFCDAKAKESSNDRDIEQWGLAGSCMYKARQMVERL